MSHDSRASELARAGFDLWEAGRLEEAVALYQRALQAADPDHYEWPDIHAQLAGVLAALGRDDEARDEYRASLDVSLHDDREGAGSAVAVARYFLGDHLLKMGEPAQALEVVLQTTGLAARQGWLLAVIEARALHALGRKAEAMIAAEQAVECAPGHKAEELQRELASILAERLP